MLTILPKNNSKIVLVEELVVNYLSFLAVIQFSQRPVHCHHHLRRSAKKITEFQLYVAFITKIFDQGILAICTRMPRVETWAVIG